MNWRVEVLKEENVLRGQGREETVIVAPHQCGGAHPTSRPGAELDGRLEPPGGGWGSVGVCRQDDMPGGKGTPGWLNNFATSGNRTLHAPAELDIHHQHRRTAVAYPDCPLSTCSSRCIQGNHGLCASPPPQARRESALRPEAYLPDV